MKYEISFSGRIKEELSRHISDKKKNCIAEITAIVGMCGKVSISSREQYSLKVRTENISVARKYFTLLQKTFNIDSDVTLDEERMQDFYSKFGNLEAPVSQTLIKNSCCQRAFLRGAFLSIGSISDPQKGYHMEFVCTDEAKAGQLQKVIQGFEIDAKIVMRKKYYVVYLKEGAAIVDLLNIMEAHVALMNLENLRILKDMRNSINRRVNCEAANITKTVNAATKQIEDIQYIKEHYGFDNLAENLRQMAELRLDYPDATLKELGQYLTPPVGKSGVNHRLRKLSELAEELRKDN